MPVAKVKPLKVQQVVREPLWRGPEVDGVTFSLLSRYIADKERFRLLVIEGLKEPETFRHALHFGSAWHVCEEAFAASGNPIVNNPVANPPWLRALQNYCRELAIKYKESATQVDKWYNVVKLQFPLYIDYWKKHPDVKSRQPICQEKSFAVEYLLPSGRKVLLRGKFDSVDLIDKKIYVFETKAKGDPNEQQILRQLNFDAQTMIYAVVAAACEFTGYPFGGVRYNVIRRPLGGGKHSITQHKGRKTKKGLVGVESEQQFYARLAGLIAANGSEFFKRWRVEISRHDLTKFANRCLDPILENLCDDYVWWAKCYRLNQNVFANDLPRPLVPIQHFQLPYGVYNSLAEGGSTAYDEYLATGSLTGLERTTNLFPELTEVQSCPS